MFAAREAIHHPVLVQAAAVIAAMALGITLMVMLAWMLLVPQPIALPPVQHTAPVGAPGEYRIPSEPVDYGDSNYIGSYGG
jgi:hypothetical protein